jgi:hypothetical protein
MKKIAYLLTIAAASMLFVTPVKADHHGWGRHHHHHHHHGHHAWGGGYGYAPPPVNYYPQQQYYQPPAQYYPPQPAYQGGYYDNRSHQGLAGGVVGSVFGYELGNGHPLAAGIGAAAGSFLGNGMGWRY